MSDSSDLKILTKFLDVAKALGADHADAVLLRKERLSASVRLGEKEDIIRAEGVDLGLRVFKGQSQAVIATADLSQDSLHACAERAIAMAQAAPPDPYAGLADDQRLYQGDADYDLYDAHEMPAEDLAQAAMEAEDAARAVDGVTNSEGAGAERSTLHFALATSAGFAQARKSTSSSLSTSVIAGSGTMMERDYAYSSARHWSDLESAASIGARAGERAVKRLNPTKVDTGTLPVVFDPRAGHSLLGHFISAINGQSISRGTSFLLRKMKEQIFAPGITIMDDPTRRRGLKSRHFDAEGVTAQPLKLIDKGVLQSWLMDSATARQLGLETTGHAARGPSTPISPTASNVYMDAGAISPEDLISDIKLGFYVTELIGMGVNSVTGDYSRGAGGFLIEDGVITKPISEVTIAGNLLDMFSQITPANDLEFRYGTNAPTLRLEQMTVAGN